MIRDMESFDQEHQLALSRLWFLGDVHGQFGHIAQAILDAQDKPRWIIFLGDIDIDHRPFAEIIAPVRQAFPDVRVAFIHGNHDADTYDHWTCLHDCGDAVALHGKVLDLDGVRVAGLGGNFMARVWDPSSPSGPSFRNKDKAMNQGAFQFRGGQRPWPGYHAAIYPDDVDRLEKLRADILITHEAPSCHPFGFEALDQLSRSMRIVRSFHGHHHDDQSEAYALQRSSLGFDAKAVSFAGIKNGLGEVIVRGQESANHELDPNW